MSDFVLLAIKLLMVFAIPYGLALLITKSLRLPDMVMRVWVVLVSLFIGLVPFANQVYRTDTFAWQLEDGTYVSRAAVENGAQRETKLPVKQARIPRTQWQIENGEPVLSANKDVLLVQRSTFDITRAGEALKYGIDLAGGTNLIYQANQKDIEGKAVTPEKMTQLVAQVAKRINPAGTKETVIRQVGLDKIEIIVPGADPAAVQEVKDSILNLGKLEFAIVANKADHGGSTHPFSDFDILSEGLANPDSTVVTDPETGEVVAMWLPMVKTGDDGKPEPGHQFLGNDQIATRPSKRERYAGYTEVLVLQSPEEDRVTGRFLTRVTPGMDRYAQPAVNFNFNSEGASRFAALTSRNKSTSSDGSRGVDRYLAVVLNDEVRNAPTIGAVISSSGQITGMGTAKEVNKLVDILNAGALPVELIKTPISEFSVSPTLGADVTRKGMLALWVAALVVVAFMGGYYLLAGAVADFAMMLNLLFIAASMSILDAAFTLPGLAGLVLSAGMAVDANVLIYERIREEQERGASLRMAIHNGFDKALSAIIDSNLSTIITALILYVIGTEQVKGFAVSLFIGLVMNLFTAVFVSRVVLTVMERGRLIKKLHMFQAIRKTNIDFINMQFVTSIGSVALIAAGLIAFIARGTSNYDIDFSGGTMVTMQFNEATETDAVRKKLKDSFGNVDLTLERLTLLGESNVGTTGTRFRLRTTEQSAEVVEKRINDAFSEKLKKYKLAYTPLTTIAAAKPKAGDEKAADAKKDDEKKDDKEATASANPFAGGSETKLSFTAQGKEEDIAPATVSRYLSDALLKQAIADPGSQFKLEGLEGAGTKTAEGQVKLYSAMRLSTTSQISPDKLEAALKGVREQMDQKPIFDELTTFATSVAEETKMYAVAAIVLSLIALVVYIWFRFDTVIYGIAAVVALAHDVLVALGMLSLGAYLSYTPIGPLLMLDDFKINMAIVAAFLTIVGYSLNDTIVIFDRLRELKGKAPRVNRDMINLAVNQTLSRTLLTTLTVILTVLILYVLGGEGIHGFAFTMLMGCLAGTYSTIFIANPIVLWLTERTELGKVGAPAPKAVVAASK